MTAVSELRRPSEIRLGINEVWYPYKDLTQTPSEYALSALARRFTLQIGDLPDISFFLYFGLLSGTDSPAGSSSAIAICTPKGELSKKGMIELHREAYVNGGSANYNSQKRIIPIYSEPLNNLLLHGEVGSSGLFFRANPSVNIETTDAEIISFTRFQIETRKNHTLDYLIADESLLTALPSLSIYFTLSRDRALASKAGRLLSFLDHPEPPQ